MLCLFVAHVILWRRNNAEYWKKTKKTFKVEEPFKGSKTWLNNWQIGDFYQDFYGVFVWLCLSFGALVNKQEMFVIKMIKSFFRSTINLFNILVKLNESWKCTITPTSFDKVKLVIMWIITLIFITIWSLCTLKFAHHFLRRRRCALKYLAEDCFVFVIYT